MKVETWILYKFTLDETNTIVREIDYINYLNQKNNHIFMNKIKRIFLNLTTYIWIYR